MIDEPGHPTGHPVISFGGEDHAEDHFRSVACSFRARRSRVCRRYRQDGAGAGYQVCADEGERVERQCQDGPPACQACQPSSLPQEDGHAQDASVFEDRSQACDAPRQARLTPVRGGAACPHIAPPLLAAVRPTPWSPMVMGRRRIVTASAPRRNVDSLSSAEGLKAFQASDFRKTGCSWGYRQSVRRSWYCRSRSRLARVATTAGRLALWVATVPPISRSRIITAPNCSPS